MLNVIEQAEAEIEAEAAEPKISLENEISKLIELLVIALTGKELHQQSRLLNESSINLALESKPHMLWLVKQIEDDSIQPILWEINKLKHVMQKFERIVEEDGESREARRWLNEK